jgi:YggT family protein
VTWPDGERAAIYVSRRDQVKNACTDQLISISGLLWPASLVPSGPNRYFAAAFRPPSAIKRADQPMRAILDIILIALNLYIWLLIAAAILSWLIAFNVVNTRNQFVNGVAEFLYRITEPALRPIRQFLPSLGGLDISPIILILLIMLIERIIVYYIYPNVF